MVVYLSLPTSNHNPRTKICVPVTLYIFRFLHQTTTVCGASGVEPQLYIFRFLHQTTTPLMRTIWHIGCISFASYIKPQHDCSITKAIGVVYLSLPTSNHNLSNGGRRGEVVVYLSLPTSNHNLVVA